MAQNDIEEYARILNDGIEEQRAYEEACAASEAEQAFDEGDSTETLDPAACGFKSEKELNPDITEDDIDNYSVWGAKSNLKLQFDDPAAMSAFENVLKNFDGATDEKPEYDKNLMKKEISVSGRYRDLLEVLAFYLGYDSSDIMCDELNADPLEMFQHYGTVSMSDPSTFNEDAPADELAETVTDVECGIAPEAEPEFNEEELAEADYREEVAHLLDPIGVKASTANLAAQNAAAQTAVSDLGERVKKLEEKLAESEKAVNEDTIENIVSKAELKGLDGLKTDMTIPPEDAKKEDAKKVVEDFLKRMDEISDRIERGKETAEDKAWLKQMVDKYQISRQLLNSLLAPLQKSGFAPPTQERTVFVPPSALRPGQTRLPGDEPGTIYRIMQNTLEPVDDHFQRRSIAKKQAKKDAEELEKTRREENFKTVSKAVRGQDWTQDDWTKLMNSMDSKQKKDFMNELIADAKARNTDPKAAGEEVLFIKTLFNKPATFRDFGAAWGSSHVGAMKYFNNTLDLMYQAIEAMGVKLPDDPEKRGKNARAWLMKFSFNPALKEKFKDALKSVSRNRWKGSIVNSDPTHVADREAAKAAAEKSETSAEPALNESTVDIDKFFVNAIKKQMKISHFAAKVGSFKKEQLPERISAKITEEYGEKFLDDADEIIFFKGNYRKKEVEKLFTVCDKALGDDANRLVIGDFKKLTFEDAPAPAPDTAPETTDDGSAEKPVDDEIDSIVSDTPVETPANDTGSDEVVAEAEKEVSEDELNEDVEISPDVDNYVFLKITLKK